METSSNEQPTAAHFTKGTYVTTDGKPPPDVCSAAAKYIVSSADST
jgi:hypothetical protein